MIKCIIGGTYMVCLFPEICGHLWGAMMKSEAGCDFETDPESEHAVEILTWQLLRTWF